MSTRRERLERKIEKRRQWADSRRAEAERRLTTARSMASAIPFGQPILVGHHSEKRDRNYRGRIDSNFSKGFESMNMAKHHESKAAGLEAALETSIFSDDVDAVEALEARIAQREAELARMKLVNKLYRKKDDAGLAALGLTYDGLKAAIDKIGLSFVKAPYEGYQLSNLGARIRTDKARIAQVKARAAIAAKAEAAPSGIVVESASGWSRITFAEKPDRAVINDLKTAGFRWGSGSWHGYENKIPDSVKALTSCTGRGLESSI